MGARWKNDIRCQWVIISDPLGIGGFEKGIKLATQEVCHMLRFHSFTIGTTIQHRTHGRFKIEKEMDNRPLRMRNPNCVAVVTSAQRLKFMEL